MFPRNVKNLENTENHCFRQSVKTLINVTFWEVFSGQNTKNALFRFLAQKSGKGRFFALRGTFSTQVAPKMEKLKKRELFVFGPWEPWPS